jgi:hypothetical protein
MSNSGQDCSDTEGDNSQSFHNQRRRAVVKKKKPPSLEEDEVI